MYTYVYMYTTILICTHTYIHSLQKSTGAFLAPFQDAPLDLDFPPHGFYHRRQAAIEARLAELAGMEGPALAGASDLDGRDCFCCWLWAPRC